ncbi:MAG: hypothetical protein WCF23_19540 [Candidatus Nitrosopolaris sp.]
METVSIKKLFLVIAFSGVAAMVIGPGYSWVFSIITTQPANAVQQFSSTLHRNNQLNPFGNLNASSSPNQFNIRSNVNPFPNLPSPGSSASTSSLSQNQYPYQYPYGYQSQPSSSPITAQGSSQSQSQNQLPYPYQQGQQTQQQPQQTSPQPPSTVQPQQSQSSTLPSVTNPSQYQPQQPQPQNQSSSSLINAPQYPYQPQQPSQSLTTGQPSVSTLVIVTHVNNTGSRIDANAADNLTQIVENTYTNPDGYAFVYHYMKGSQIGVTLSLQPGAFSVYELNKNIKSSNPTLNQSTYDVTYSGDCRTVKSNTGSTTYGYGTINMCETKTCTVTLLLHK